MSHLDGTDRPTSQWEAQKRAAEFVPEGSPMTNFDPITGANIPAEQPTVDERNPRRCRYCQSMLFFDGWTLVHESGLAEGSDPLDKRSA